MKAPLTWRFLQLIDAHYLATESAAVAAPYLSWRYTVPRILSLDNSGAHSGCSGGLSRASTLGPRNFALPSANQRCPSKLSSQTVVAPEVLVGLLSVTLIDQAYVEVHELPLTPSDALHDHAQHAQGKDRAARTERRPQWAVRSLALAVSWCAADSRLTP
jgi:hypothetical protein